MLFRCLPLIAALLCPASTIAQTDRIYFNGNIITQDESRPHVQAMLVSGGSIIATGTNAEIRQAAGINTQAIDLRGHTVIPGLIDSHIHAVRAGLTYSSEVSWIDIPELETGLRHIADAARADKDAWLVVAGGWNIQQFATQRRPELSDIEGAAPGRAVYIQLAYNAALVSPEGLRRLAIEREDQLPEGAKFERNKQGGPTGWIIGSGPAIIALFDLLPKQTLVKNIEGTKRFFKQLNRYGITGVIDPGGHNLRPSEYAALFEMAERGDLSLRVAFSAFAPRPGHEREDFERLIEDYSSRKHPLLQFNGIGEAITWGFYNNNDPTPAQQSEFESVALWAASKDLRLTVHWNNDASVTHLLNVLERVNASHELKPLRWSIAHLHDASRATIERMHNLGLGWLVQNAGYFAAPSYLRTRGDAVHESPPIASALRIGMPVGGGTDAHRVMSFNPFLSLRWMIDGVTVGGLSTRRSNELLSREEALHVYTSGSAWFTGDESRRGKIKAGYDADFAVLDRDYFAVPLKEFGNMGALLTSVAGTIVHAAGPFSDTATTSAQTGVSTEASRAR